MGRGACTALYWPGISQAPEREQSGRGLFEHLSMPTRASCQNVSPSRESLRLMLVQDTTRMVKEWRALTFLPRCLFESQCIQAPVGPFRSGRDKPFSSLPWIPQTCLVLEPEAKPRERGLIVSSSQQFQHSSFCGSVHLAARSSVAQLRPFL